MIINENRRRKLEELEKAIGYTFKDKGILNTALTHSSHAHEHRPKMQHNERLEFLGDTVLNMVISEYLYLNYPQLSEGRLTKARAVIVSEASLADAARRINLGRYILLGRGEENSGGRNRDSILADALESIIAAVYLDGGLEHARTFVLNSLGQGISEVMQGRGLKDYKTDLQEILQQSSYDHIEYRIVKDSGPDHDKIFYAQVFHGNRLIGEGTGRSKKEAEQQAAQNALKDMQK
ncbi:MAG: ribonuclease III [Clostridiales bacterium]|nr:ribonuclease III [Clostridiales bacterium]